MRYVINSCLIQSRHEQARRTNLSDDILTQWMFRFQSQHFVDSNRFQFTRTGRRNAKPSRLDKSSSYKNYGGQSKESRY